MKVAPQTTSLLLCLAINLCVVTQSQAATSIGEDSCTDQNGGAACNDNMADLNAADNSCNGILACSANEKTVTANFGSCIGDEACFMNEVPLQTGIYSCLGEYACSFNLDAGDGATTMEVLADSCTHGSCRNGTGSGLFWSSSCTAKESCSYWTARDSFEVGINSCGPPVEGAQLGDGEFSCSHLIGTSIAVNQGSCQGFEACQSIFTADRIQIGKGSCLGSGSCNSISPRGEYVFGEDNTGGPVTIGDGSCTGDNACTSIRTNSGTIQIGKNSCLGRGSCTSIVTPDSFVIGDNACNSDFSCQGCQFSVADGAEDCTSAPTGSSAPAGMNRFIICYVLGTFLTLAVFAL